MPGTTTFLYRGIIERLRTSDLPAKVDAVYVDIYNMYDEDLLLYLYDLE